MDSGTIYFSLRLSGHRVVRTDERAAEVLMHRRVDWRVDITCPPPTRRDIIISPRLWELQSADPFRAIIRSIPSLSVGRSVLVLLLFMVGGGVDDGLLAVLVRVMVVLVVGMWIGWLQCVRVLGCVRLYCLDLCTSEQRTNIA
jgi:hypothetical protein